MKQIRKCILFVFFGFMMLLSKTLMALPVSIESCITSGQCFYEGIGFSTNIDGNSVVGHRVVDVSSGAPDIKVLMEYQLGSASNMEQVYVDPISYEAGPVESSAISGSLWLEVSQLYDLSENSHAMTLYFDDVSPPTAP